MYYQAACFAWLMVWTYIKYGEIIIEGITVEEAANALYTLLKGR